MGEAYHLAELAIARDSSHPAHLLPPAVAATSRVLDIGCGAAQTLIAAYPRQLTYGIDIDLSALGLGRKLTNNVCFVCAKAEALPFQTGEFDLVIARITLPYTDMCQSLREICRILKPGGLVWITLQTFADSWELAKASTWKGKLFFLYIVLNSALFHLWQRQFPWFGRYESFQTERGIRRALQRSGFSDIVVERGRHFLVTASRMKPGTR